MKKIMLFSFFVSLLASSASHAYPDLMKPVGTSGMPLKVFRDHDNDQLFWYIPLSIEPWKRDQTYKSVLYRNDAAKVLTFIFRGQASVEQSMLETIAKGHGVSVNNFTPIFLESSKDLVCQNFYSDNTNVSWVYPKQIGNYLEVVPVSIRVKNDADLVEEVASLINGGGLACTVSVSFKAYSIAYKAHYDFDLNQVYSRFEAGLHGEYWFFEVDLHTILQKMSQDGLFTFHTDEDPTIAQTDLDKKMNAAFEDLEKRIVTLMFTPAMTIPSGGLAGRGKAFSLRTDYVRSETNSHFSVRLSSDKVALKESQIGLRLGVN